MKLGPEVSISCTGGVEMIFPGEKLYPSDPVVSLSVLWDGCCGNWTMVEEREILRDFIEGVEVTLFDVMEYERGLGRAGAKGPLFPPLPPIDMLVGVVFDCKSVSVCCGVELGRWPSLSRVRSE